MADPTAPIAPPAPGQTWVDQSLGGSNPDDMIAVVAPNGVGGTVARKNLAEALNNGFQLEHPQATHERALETEYGDSPWEAAGEGALSTITGGLSRYINPERQRQVESRNEGAAMAGGVLGAFAPIGAPGLIGKAGMAAEGLIAGEGAGLGARVLGGVGRGVTEGLGYGAIGGNEQVALSETPMTWEGAAATIGSNALGGAAYGGLIGGAAGLLGEGARVAKEYANKQVEAISAGTNAEEQAAIRGEHPEIANYDAKQTSQEIVKEEGVVKAQKATGIAETNAGIKAETTRLADDQTERARQFYDKAQAYAIENPFIDAGDDSMAAVQLGHADTKLKKGIDNKPGFIERRGAGMHGGAGTFQTGLQEQQTVLERLTANADEVLGNADAERAAFHDSIPRPKIPAYEELPTDASHVAQVTAKDLEAHGLFELPGAGVDEARMERVKANLGKAEEWNQPIRLTMDEDGKLFVEDGRHRLRAALEEGGGRELTVEIDRGSQGFDAAMGTDQLAGEPIKRPTGFAELPEAVPGEEAAKRGGRPKPGFRGEGEAPAAQGTYLSPPQSRVYAEWAGLPKPEISLNVNDADLAKFRAAVATGEVPMPKVQNMERAQALLEKNRATQAELKELQAKPTSKTLEDLADRLDQIKHDATPTPRLQALKAHAADLQVPKGLAHTIATGMGGAVGGAVGHVFGPMGSIAGAFIGRDFGSQVFEKLAGKLVKSNAQRGKLIKASIAKMFAKGVGASAKVLPNATKIIPAIQYASKKHADSQLGRDDMKPTKDATVAAFRQRARELNSVTERAPDGSYQPRMLALSDMHDRVAALWQIAPGVANGIEKLQAAKWAFLASKMPRNPAPPTLQIGPDSWEPSKQQLSLFARYMEVAEHPEAAVQRLADGTISPGDVETLKAVWPAHYDDIRQQCMNHASTLQRTLPYLQRLNLSILLDVDVDPALSPAAMAVFQAPPPPPPEPSRPAAPSKPLPTGMVEPTQAQRMSSK